MKSLLSIILVVFALSLCNLTGKRSNENSNANRPPSGTTEETNQNSASQPTPQDRVELRDEKTIGSGLPPAPRNHNSAMPRVAEDAPPPPKPPSVPRAPISGGVMNGRATHLPKPTYPAIAKAAHASGAVSVRVVVDENGNVISASAVSGHPLLQQSAVQAARQAKFSPTKLSGQPVKVTGIIVYNFVAQ